MPDQPLSPEAARDRALPAGAGPMQTMGLLALRVRYCECDPMGVVHHASYLPWLEMGRTEMLRASGVSYAQLEAAGVFLVIVKLDCRYRRSAYYDDVLRVQTRVVGGSRVKIEHEYEVTRVESGQGPGAAGAPIGEIIFSGRSTLACVDASGRVRELPAWLVCDGKSPDSRR